MYMKKIKILTLIAVFIALFASCEETYEGGGNGGNGGNGSFFSNDCYCTVSGDMVNCPLYTESEPTIEDFEGDCADATWSDLPLELQSAWLDENGDAADLIITCW